MSSYLERQGMKNAWLTPPALMDELRARYAFDFDPCPFPKPEDFDGLAVPWGRSNYVNPPFTGWAPWVKKALGEREQGKSSLLMVPVDAWVFDLLKAGAETDFIGRVRWLDTETKKPVSSSSRPIIGFHVRGVA